LRESSPPRRRESLATREHGGRCQAEEHGTATAVVTTNARDVSASFADRTSVEVATRNIHKIIKRRRRAAQRCRPLAIIRRIPHLPQPLLSRLNRTHQGTHLRFDNYFADSQIIEAAGVELALRFRGLGDQHRGAIAVVDLLPAVKQIVASRVVQIGGDCAAASRQPRRTEFYCALLLLSPLCPEDHSGATCIAGGVSPCTLDAGAPPAPVSRGPVGPCGWTCGELLAPATGAAAVRKASEVVEVAAGDSAELDVPGGVATV
jgi:hypothetical protein